MSERAIELLVLPEDTSSYLLDIGCGSGLSGSVLEDQGHFWVGMDISTAMLGNDVKHLNICYFRRYFVDIAVEREVEGDLLLSDMGQGCPFRAGKYMHYKSVFRYRYIFYLGTFDGAISISALQWLCNADKSSHKPVQRLYKFFSMLYACLVRSNVVLLKIYIMI